MKKIVQLFITLLLISQSVTSLAQSNMRAWHTAGQTWLV